MLCKPLSHGPSDHIGIGVVDSRNSLVYIPDSNMYFYSDGCEESQLLTSLFYTRCERTYLSTRQP